MSQTVSVDVSRFFRFMRLFGITFFSITRIEFDYIYAIVAWEEDCRNGIPDSENVQEVRWTRVFEAKLDDALMVGEYAYDADWISSDQIVVNEGELLTSFGWDKERVTMAMSKLMQIRVSMIDDGEETDFFFLHG